MTCLRESGAPNIAEGGRGGRPEPPDRPLRVPASPLTLLLLPARGDTTPLEEESKRGRG